MEEIQETSGSCPTCITGTLQTMGVIGKLLISRCRDCGVEHSKKVSESSVYNSILSDEINTLRQCITCKARYAAVKDSDLCPECYFDFLGVTAAKDNTETIIPAPVNCDFCSMQSKRVQAQYDGRTKIGSWAYMCEDHFRENGVGLGIGSGQRLKVEGK